MNVGSHRQRLLFLLTAFVLASAILIAYATIATLDITGKSAVERLGHDQVRLAQMIAGSLEESLSVRLQYLLDASQESNAGNVPATLSPADLKKLYARSGGCFSNILLLDANKKIVCSYPVNAYTKEITEFVQSKNLETFSGELRIAVENKRTMAAWAPIKEHGTLLAFLDCKYVRDVFLKNFSGRLGQELFLFDREWSLLAYQASGEIAPAQESPFTSRFASLSNVQLDGFVSAQQIKGLAPRLSTTDYLAYAPVRLAGEHLILGIGVPRAKVTGFFLQNPLTVMSLASTRIFAIVACAILFYLLDKRRMLAREEAVQLREEQKLLARLEESEERYKTLVENLLSPVVIFQDDRIKFANKIFHSLTQYSNDEVTSPDFGLLTLVYEDDRQMVQEYIARLLDGEKIEIPLEIRYVKKNGEIVIGLTLSTAINFGGKRAIETVVVDITHIKHIEQELGETKKRLQYLLDNAPIMIFSVDEEGKFSYVNKETLNTTGYRYDDWIGKSFAPIVHPDDLALAVSKFEEGRKGDPRREYKLRIHNAAGKERLLHITSDTIWENGQFKGSLIIGSDVTEQQRLQLAVKETRDHLANIIENAGDAIITVDTTGSIVSWNKTAESMFHLTAPYAFHKPLHLLLNANSALTGSLINRVAAGETVRDVELECLRNGGRLDTLLTLSPIRNASGHVIGISCFAKDITERRNLEKQLKRDKQFIDGLIENAHALIAAVNEKGNIVIFNRRFEEVSGYTKEEAIGQNMVELLVPGEYQNAISENLQTLRIDKPIIEIEIPILSKSGRLLTVTWNVAAVNLLSGHSGIVVVGQDVTEQKRMQEELMQSKKLASIGELVSGVAHELNNPLTIIMGYSQLLISEQVLREKHRDMAQKVMDAAGRSKRIVENLLAFARKKKLKKHEFDINEILESTLIIREHNFTVNNIRITRNYEEPLPPVYGDSHQIQQVFLNLINNAFDAMFAANREGTLAVKTVGKHDMIVIEIADTGPGIPEAIREKIFDPFFTTKEVGKGTGLGMSLSYGIVKEHGGRIYLDKTYRKGAKFVVEFPVNQHSDSN
jgi:PAS domain S-box-containing protein